MLLDDSRTLFLNERCLLRSLSTVATYFAPEPSMLYVAAKQSSELLVWAVTVTA